MSCNFKHLTRYDVSHTIKVEVSYGFEPIFSHEVLKSAMACYGISIYTHNSVLLYQFGYMEAVFWKNGCEHVEDCDFEGYEDRTIRSKYLWALKQGHRVFRLKFHRSDNGSSFQFEPIVKGPNWWPDVLADGIAIVNKDVWPDRCFAETYVLRILEEKLAARVNGQLNDTLYQADVWMNDGGFALPFSHLDPEEALKRGQEEFPEAFLTEDDFRIEESYCRKIVPEITYGSNPMVVYRTETLASDSRYVLLPHA